MNPASPLYLCFRTSCFKSKNERLFVSAPSQKDCNFHLQNALNLGYYRIDRSTLSRRQARSRRPLTAYS